MTDYVQSPLSEMMRKRNQVIGSIRSELGYVLVTSVCVYMCMHVRVHVHVCVCSCCGSLLRQKKTTLASS